MDRITDSMMSEFVSAQSLGKLEKAQQFERFATYCVLSRESTETFDIEDFCVGAGGDAGIDSIAILINGSLVTSTEEIDDLHSTNGYIDATFLLVQAKSSSSFSSADIGTFLFGAKDFFSSTHQLSYNTELQEALKLQEKVYSLGAAFRRNPTCRLYYVTTGQWTNDANLTARISAGTQDLEELGLFSEAKCFPIDASALQELYRKTKNTVACEFSFSTKVAMPDIEGVKEAYLGILPMPEYIKLLKDELGRIRKHIFYDNVRDFQDYNEVNTQIRDTLSNKEQRTRFPVLNNGVTIVTQTLRFTGNKCFIENYQIVNGCQTSHVIFDQEAALDSSVFIPVRLVATDDEAVTSAITRATNTQTQVRSEELHALAEFPKKLELYFESFDPKKKLYYERRTRQYASRTDVEKVRVVPIHNLVRSFTAMFLGEPHRVGRDYRRLLADVGTRIFAKQHQLEPYYVSAYAQYRLEYFFRVNNLDATHKPARYQILFAARHLGGMSSLAALQSNQMKKDCEKFLLKIWDDEQCLALFQEAAEVVAGCAETVRESAPSTRGSDIYRVALFTQTVEKSLE